MRLVRRQAGYALRAAATASAAAAGVALGKTPTTSSRRAGLWLSNWGPCGGRQASAMRLRPVTGRLAVVVTMTGISLRMSQGVPPRVERTGADGPGTRR